MGTLCLLIASFTGIAVWPIMRWGSSKNSDSVVLGFWMSVSTAFLFSLVVLLHTGITYDQELWICGFLFAIAYAAGFAGLMTYCQKIGPIGPTATINNLAKIFSVAYVLLWLDPHPLNFYIGAGIAGGCIAVILLSLSTRAPTGGTHPITMRWLVLALLGGLLSGLSLTTQTHVGVRFPGVQNTVTFMWIGFLGSSLMLLPFILKRQIQQRKVEFIAGSSIGILSGIGIPSTLIAFSLVPAETVFPVIVTFPLVTTFLIGRFCYGERLSNSAVAGCVCAIVALTLIEFGSLKN